MKKFDLLFLFLIFLNCSNSSRLSTFLKNAPASNHTDCSAANQTSKIVDDFYLDASQLIKQFKHHESMYKDWMKTATLEKDKKDLKNKEEKYVNYYIKTAESLFENMPFVYENNTNMAGGNCGDVHDNNSTEIHEGNNNTNTHNTNNEPYFGIIELIEIFQNKYKELNLKPDSSLNKLIQIKQKLTLNSRILS